MRKTVTNMINELLSFESLSLVLTVTQIYAGFLQRQCLFLILQPSKVKVNINKAHFNFFYSIAAIPFCLTI